MTSKIIVDAGIFTIKSHLGTKFFFQNIYFDSRTSVNNHFSFSFSSYSRMHI